MGGGADIESDPIIVSHFLQHNKAEVLSQLQEKTEGYREWEKVVVEHMAEKERERLREEQEIREKQAAVKVATYMKLHYGNRESTPMGEKSAH